MVNDIQIRWLPISQPFAGDYKFFPPPHDGDTLKILDTIRMLSIDTPEIIGTPDEEDVLLELIGLWMDTKTTAEFITVANQYVATLPKPRKSAFQKKIDNAISRLVTRNQSEMPEPLRKYLRPKLANQAATRHNEQAVAARKAFEDAFFKVLVPLKKQPKYMVNNQHIPLENIPLKDFSKIALIVTGEQRDFNHQVVAQRDSNGRILAYIAKNLSAKELKENPRETRTTINLMMLENGWAAPFIIYPSLPTENDLDRMVSAVTNAIDKKLGIWEKWNNQNTTKKVLLPYEYRMCRKLIGNYDIEKKILYRSCMDMTTKQLHEPWDYFNVPPQHRLFIINTDKEKALEKLSAAFTIRDNPLKGANTHLLSNTIYGMWADQTTGKVYAVGECGTFYEWTKDEWKNGQPAKAVQLDTKVDFYDVFGFSDKNIWAVGTFGKVCHRVNGNWSSEVLKPDGFAEPVWLEAVWGSGPKDVYIAGDECTIFHYNGTEWTEKAPPKAGQTRRKTHFYSICGLRDGSVVYAVGAFGRIMKLDKDKEPVWIKTQYTTNLNGIQLLPGTDEFIVCGQKGVIFKLKNDKVYPLQEQQTDDFYALDVKDKDHYLVVGRKGRAVYYHKGEWTTFSVGQNVYFEGVVYAGEDRFCGAGWFGRLMSFDAQSFKWYQHQSGSGDKIMAVALNNQGTFLAAADTGILLFGNTRDTQEIQTAYLAAVNISEIKPLSAQDEFLVFSPDGYSVKATVQGKNLVLSNEFKYTHLNQGIQAKLSSQSGQMNILTVNAKSYGYDNYNFYNLSKPANSNTIKAAGYFPVRDETIDCVQYCVDAQSVLVGGSRGSVLMIPNLDNESTWSVFHSGTYKPVTAMQFNAGKLVLGYREGSLRVIDISTKSLIKAASIGAPTYYCVQGTSKGFVFGGESGWTGLLSFTSPEKPKITPTQSPDGQKDFLVSIELDDMVYLAGVEQLAIYDATGIRKQYYSLPSMIITAIAEYNGNIYCGTGSGECYTGKISKLINGTGVFVKDLTHPQALGSPIVHIRKTTSDLMIILEDGSGYCNNVRIESPGGSKYQLSSCSQDGSSGDICFSGQARNTQGKYSGYFGFMNKEKFTEVSIPDADLTSVSLHGEFTPDTYWAGGFSGSLLLYSKGCWFKVHTGIGNQLYGAAQKNGYIAVVGKQGAIRFETSKYIEDGIKKILKD